MKDLSNQRTTNKGGLEFCEIPHQRFLEFLMAKARTPEVGPISSQYEEQIRQKSPHIFCLGVFACNDLACALSYGVHNSRLNPSLIAARLDVVVTEPRYRGRGLCGLLLSHFLHTVVESYGSRLTSISTVAAHPAVAHFLEGLGFAATEVHSEAPRYSIEFSQASLESFAGKLEEIYRKKIQKMRQGCISCRRHAWEKPWCRAS